MALRSRDHLSGHTCACARERARAFWLRAPVPPFFFPPFPFPPLPRLECTNFLQRGEREKKSPFRPAFEAAHGRTKRRACALHAACMYVYVCVRGVLLSSTTPNPTKPTDSPALSRIDNGRGPDLKRGGAWQEKGRGGEYKKSGGAKFIGIC